ncbi:hypothetical protein [Estrella lausannensis]|uniref:Uncharacterized protein n=1 Tax=Estrella lausannensis TaxID=483423 RepID=A0A0H5DMY8_9BACT|nr:hypothetical protein [Estrella lausannensis]CRX37377.1 Conserved hypothetical protein [Estrella lausannensis]
MPEINNIKSAGQPAPLSAPVPPECLKNELEFVLDYIPDEETYLITSEGGGGHKSAADAIQYKLLDQAGNKSGAVHRVDVLKNSILPNFIADKATGVWDQAKKEGNVEKQISLVKGKFLGIVTWRRLADILFFLPIFLKTFFTLWGNRKITRIVDTQAMGTTAIVAAARLANFLFQRHIEVLKMMTDMPTEEAIHFAASAKSLSSADKKIYRILSTAPFPQYKDETESNYIDRMDAWWKEHFNLSLKEGQVRYTDFPLRPAFIRAKEGTLSGDIGIKLNNADEKKLLVDAGIIDEDTVSKRGGKAFDAANGTIVKTEYDYSPVDVGSEDMVGLITIGSMANAGATKAYIEDVIDLANLHNDLASRDESGEGHEMKQFHLFVACGRHEAGKPSLFSDVAAMIGKYKQEGRVPQNLHIVPMGFQSDEEMAPIMHRANFGIYGAGGLTTMETLAASDPERAHVFIHSDAKEAKADMSDAQIQEELLKGYVLWERGNAEFQLKNDGYKAQLVAPQEIFRKRLTEILELEAGMEEIYSSVTHEHAVGESKNATAEGSASFGNPLVLDARPFTQIAASTAGVVLS